MWYQVWRYRTVLDNDKVFEWYRPNTVIWHLFIVRMKTLNFPSRCSFYFDLGPETGWNVYCTLKLIFQIKLWVEKNSWCWPRILNSIAKTSIMFFQGWCNTLCASNCTLARVFFLSLFSRKLDDKLRKMFTGLLCYACWDTPSENTGIWHLPTVSSAFKHCYYYYYYYISIYMNFLIQT